MTLCTAYFETGTNGNDLATGDTGNATAFDAITLSSGAATAKYSSAQAAHGSLSAAFATSGGAGQAYFHWVAALGTVTDHYGRLYLYLPANPASVTPIVHFNTAGTLRARIDITTAGKLQGFDAAGAALFTTLTNAIALNQWVRIEWYIVHSATVGSGEVKLFNTATSTTATETKTGTSKNTGASATGVYIGAGCGAAPMATNETIYMDSIVAGATSYPGPVATTTADTHLEVSQGGVVYPGAWPKWVGPKGGWY